MKIIVFGLLLLSLVSCSEGSSEDKTVISSNRYNQKLHWDGKHKDYKQWTRGVFLAIDSLGHSLLSANPKDTSEYCPKYSKLEMNARKHFWAYLISAMAKRESNFKPETSYKENFKDRHGKYIISRGLLQLSIESSLGYKCPFTTEQDIHNPILNLRCGVMILNKWVGKDNRIGGKVLTNWKGGARYWAVLRSGSSHEYIKKVMKTEFCSLY